MTSEAQTAEQKPDHYDAFADAYARVNENGLFNRWYARPAVLNLLGDVAGRRILDAGCGSGPLLVDLEKQGERGWFRREPGDDRARSGPVGRRG